MIITYEGERYEFDFNDITVKQAMKIEKHTGVTFFEWGRILAEGGNLKALQAAGWLILHGGASIPIEDCDFKLVPLGEAFAKAAAEQEAAEQAAQAVQAGQPGPTGAVVLTGLPDPVPAGAVLSPGSSDGRPSP